MIYDSRSSDFKKERSDLRAGELRFLPHRSEAFLVFVETEDGTLKVDEGFQLFCFGAGTCVDVESHLSHIDAGDLFHEGWIRNAQDDAAEAPPLALQLDVFDLAVGHLDSVNLTLSADEDVSLEAPVDFNVFGKEADLAQDFFPAEGILGWDVELDVDRIDAEHGRTLRQKYPRLEAGMQPVRLRNSRKDSIRPI